MKIAKTLTGLLGIEAEHKTSLVDNNTKDINEEETSAAYELKENHKWWMQNKAHLFQKNKVTGQYALIFEKRVVKYDNSCIVLRNEAKTRGLKYYSIFPI
jgi:hypothetical protein